MKKKPLRILSIDDSPAWQKVLSRYLTNFGGHEVELADNGEDGLKKVPEFKPDLIILDMMMPGMTGLQVLDSLCGEPATRAIPVIILTGETLDEKARNALKTRRNFLRLEEKPANMTALLGAIENNFSAWRPGQQGTAQNGPTPRMDAI